MTSLMKARKKYMVRLFIASVMFGVLPGISVAGYSEVEPLWFSLSPADGSEGQGGRPSGRPSGKPSGRPSGKPSGKPSGRPSGGRPPSRFESEHRPIPLRKYYLNNPQPEAQGMVLHPDLSISELTLNLADKANASATLAMSDGPHHGANNFYVFDQQVKNETLIVRNAKWVTIQHSCGWGHGLKFTEERQISQSLDTVPLEIVVENLWDTNFHSTVMSGDEIHLKVLHFGQPAVKARVTIISEKGWKKSIVTDEQGQASFEMVRDYYSEKWSEFHRRQKGEIKFIASYRNSESGELNGQAFSSAKYNATFTWRYYPARREYTSLMVGLLIAVIGAGLTGTGFFLYRRKRWTGLKRLAWNE